MLEALIPGAAWRAFDWVCRRLNIRLGRAWDVRIDIQRAKNRKRETEQLWQTAEHEARTMLAQFPPLTRHVRESETRLVISVRFRDAPDDDNDQPAATGGI